MIKLNLNFRAFKIAGAMASFENETFFVIFKHSVSNFFLSVKSDFPKVWFLLIRAYQSHESMVFGKLKNVSLLKETINNI